MVNALRDWGYGCGPSGEYTSSSRAYGTRPSGLIFDEGVLYTSPAPRYSVGGNGGGSGLGYEHGVHGEYGGGEGGGDILSGVPARQIFV